MLRKSSITLIIFLVCHGLAVAEIKNTGTPFIRNFAKSDYRAGTQSWGIAQDLKGFIYFANNDGLLVYDGVQWQVYRMPNLSMVRSVYADYTGEVYVGAYNDIGRMVYSANGKMTFSSLKNLLPEEYQNFDDVWNIFPFRNRIVFQSYYAAYFYSKESPVSVLAAPSRFQSAYSVGGRLIFNDDEKGLMEYDGNELVALKGCDGLIAQAVSSVLPFGEGNDILICTKGNGMFIHDGTKLLEWDIPVNNSLIKNQIFSATLLHDKYYALGTILDGVIIIDRDGRLVQHINKKKGLQNNTILDLFPDRAGNLWLALDNGIDYVTVNSPVTFIQDPVGFGAGYNSVIYEGRLYLGTNQGLYTRDWENLDTEAGFYMIPGTYGQVWYLGVHNGILLCGHDNGTYVVSGLKAELINNITGGWKYLELKQFPGYMIGGTYSGIILFRWEQGSWKYVRQISGFNESFRVFEEDDIGNIWMSHGFKGIYRVRLSNDLETVADQQFYTVDDGLPLNYYLSVFRIRDKIIFASEKGIYEYVPDEDRFVYSVYFNQLLSPLVAISYLKEDQEGNIWYVSENRTGVYKIQDDFSYQQVTTPFILLSGRFIHGFESIYPYAPGHVIFGTENGFAHYEPQEYISSYQQFSAYITQAEYLYRDSVFYYGKGLNPSSGRKRNYSFPYKGNSFRFTFSLPVYDNAGSTEYRYRMSGLEEEWSQWSRSFIKEYSNLPDGHYSFEVMARNQPGTESLPDSLKFVVMHPWYKSVTALIAYLVTAMSLALLSVWIFNRRIEISRQRERLDNQRIYEAKEQEYIQQALQTEKDIIRIRNENLNAEMILRDKELANQAMHMVRKNEFLIKLKEELHNLKNNCHDEQLKDKIIHIVAKINREVDSNKQREVFENAFDEVNEDFMSKLNRRYPMLTPAERRLCAFIKMNISTKEIAPLLNISVRGVEIARYRIRKKMSIARDTNLTQLLLDL